MKIHHIFALSFLYVFNSVRPETALAAAVARDHDLALQCEMKFGTQKIELPAPTNQVTNEIINLGIELEKGYNYPAPGLKMELYPRVDDHITIETEITMQENEIAHPLVTKILAIIGYEKTELGYFFDTEPKATKGDAKTSIVSVKRPYARRYPEEVHIKMHTLLDDQLIHKYVATLKARKVGKRTITPPNPNLITSPSDFE